MRICICARKYNHPFGLNGVFFGGFLFGILFFICFTVLTVDIVDNTFDNHLFDVYVVAEQTDKTEILQKFLIIFRKFPERLTGESISLSEIF